MTLCPNTVQLHRVKSSLPPNHLKIQSHQYFKLKPCNARIYNCLRCHALVVLCSHCDRGNRYCMGGCSEVARLQSIARAAQKYENSRKGRINNAARQQRYRERQRNKVTDQGSGSPPCHDVVAILENQPREIPKVSKPVQFTYCHCCGCPCSPYLRQDFLPRTHRIGSVLDARRLP